MLTGMRPITTRIHSALLREAVSSRPSTAKFPTLCIPSRLSSTTSTPSTTHTTTPTTTTPSEFESPDNLRTALQKLSLQPRFYAKVHIQNKAYIVTPGDLVHLPITLRHTAIGDSLKLTTVSSFGSREYTLRAPIPSRKSMPAREFLRPGLVEVQATVVEHTKRPMVTTIKKKRRNRHAKAAKHKQPYTVLRITEVKLAEGSTLDSPPATL